jgi:hypothetical protein
VKIILARYDGVYVGRDVEKSVFYPGKRRKSRCKSFKQVHDRRVVRHKQQRGK